MANENNQGLPRIGEPYPNGNGRDPFTGLAGWWRQWSALGVVGVVCGLLVTFAIWFLVMAQRQQAEHREDINRFYETHRADLDKRDAAALDAHRSMQSQTNAIAHQEQTLRDLTLAIRGLGAELKRMREERQARNGDPEPAPPN